MKQRLLLALLMLFSSVGFMKAQASDPITIGVPKDAKVTITLTSSSFTFTSESYPQLYSGSAVVTPEGGVDKLNSKTVKWILEPEATTNYELSTATNDDSWGNLSLSLDGKVTSFVVSGAATNKFQNLITSLSFTNNGELNNLILQANAAYTTAGLPNLSKLSCSGNKLTRIPAKPASMKDADYLVGTQTPALDAITITQNNSKDGVDFSSICDLKSSSLSQKIFGSWSDKYAFTIANAKDKDSKDVTTALVGVNKAVYSFKQGDIFFDGEVTFDVNVTDANYPGVVIKGVKTSIDKPSFAVKAEVNDEKMGNVIASLADQSVAKGTTITFTFDPEDGYSFKEVEESSVKGLTFVEKKEYEGGNVAYTYTVKGNEDVSLKGIFEAQGVKVSFNEPEGGMFRITDEKGTLIANGSNVPVGSKLKVVAIPREGYSLEVGKVTLSGSTSSWEGVKEASDGRYEGEYTVLGTDKELIFNAAFTKAAYKLSVAYSNVNSVKVFANGTEVTSSNSSSNPLEYSSIPFGATLKITLGLSDANSSISSVVFNAKEYKATKITNAQYEVSGITMPAMASQLTVETVTNPNFTIVTKFTQTELTYTGQPLALPYEVTTPVGLEGFKVLYAETESGQYSETPFTNAGTYYAKLHRDEDATHKEYNSVPQAFTIAKAPLIIKEQPTVKIGKDDNNQDAYLFEGGKVVYMNGNTEVDVTKDGKFAPIDAEKECKPDWESLTIKFIPLVADGELSKNLAYNVGTGGVITKVFNSEAEGLKDYTVKVEGDVQMFNGATPITSGSKLKEGTEITFKYEEIGGNSVTYELSQVDNAGNKIGNPINKNSTVTLGGDENHNKVSEVIFKLFVEDTRSKLVLDPSLTEDALTQEVVYDGTVKEFNKNELKWATQAENGTTTSLANGGSAVNNDLKLTYFYIGAYDTKALTAGELVPEPVDAGKYRVQITRDVVGAHQPITAADNINAYLVIKPATLTAAQVPAPTASKINKGQMLSKSILTGTASVAGTYKWNETDAAVDKTSSHKVIFVPDNKNYADFEISSVGVQVTDKAILTLSVPNGYGRLEATDDKGYTYHSGDELVANTTLTINGIAESDLYELDYLKVNGNKASSNTISVGSSSIDVEGYFKVKDTKPATCKVTFSSTSVPGVGFEYVTNPTTVTTGGSYSFSLTAHPSDLSRIKVSDGTNVYTNTNGSFTISNINSDITLTVSLDNPTPYTVQLTREYKEGDDVIGTATYTGTPYHGATLRFVATPKTGYKFTGWTGITSTLATADVVVKSDLVVTAKFEAEDGTIDPNTECIVRTPYDEDVAGVHINKQGINVVKIGSDFEFTVDAYEDDLKNVKVTVDGAELKPTSENKYVISKVKKNTEVKVTLANPTRIKVVVETETKNAKGYVMGHVDVEGLFSDSTCYYNTTIRLAAYPESGVEFMNWSDVTSNTQLIRELTITKKLTIKPVFSGTPTGIEDIMAASITTGRGYVWVRGIANADVTIVSISGRVQARQRISGDTQINVPAGIYVVVLESGSDVKRAKVIVK